MSLFCYGHFVAGQSPILAPQKHQFEPIQAKKINITYLGVNMKLILFSVIAS